MSLQERAALAAKIVSVVYGHVQVQKCTCAECQDCMVDVVEALLENPDMPINDMQAERLPPYRESSLKRLTATHNNPNTERVQ